MRPSGCLRRTRSGRLAHNRENEFYAASETFLSVTVTVKIPAPPCLPPTGHVHRSFSDTAHEGFLILLFLCLSLWVSCLSGGAGGAQQKHHKRNVQWHAALCLPWRPSARRSQSALAQQGTAHSRYMGLTLHAHGPLPPGAHLGLHNRLWSTSVTSQDMPCQAVPPKGIYPPCAPAVASAEVARAPSPPPLLLQAPSSKQPLTCGRHVHSRRARPMPR